MIDPYQFKGTLTSLEAIELFEMEKKIKSQPINIHLNRFKIELISSDKKEAFFIDNHVGHGISLHYTNQLRCRREIPLMRLDISGKSHTNPKRECKCNPRDPFYGVHDLYVGKEFAPGEPHIHFYREGFGDAWAYPVPDWFTDLTDREKTLLEFLDKCNVVGKCMIQRGIADE